MQKLTYISIEKVDPIWTQDELLNIQKILLKKHMVYLDNETFEIEAGVTQTQIQIRVSLLRNDKSLYYPIECVFVKETTEKIKESEIAVTIMDYLDLYWSSYFLEERNIFIPLDWSKHEFEGISFYIRGFVRNLQLEASADDFLQKHGHGEYDIQSISSET